MDAATFRIAEPLRWRELDGAWVVFLPRAGTLCQLDGFNATVLSLVEEAPADAASLAGRIAEAAGLDPSAVLLEKVAGVVDDLRRSGLLEPVHAGALR